MTRTLLSNLLLGCTPVALKPGYTGEIKDRLENFHGKQLLYVNDGIGRNLC